MSNFDEFCREKDINHYREAFYHHCIAKGLNNPTKEELEHEWGLFLTEVTSRLLRKG
jgi:hypothetical protein